MCLGSVHYLWLGGGGGVEIIGGSLVFVSWGVTRVRGVMGGGVMKAESFSSVAMF